MTTDERIENLEKGLASARRFNRWLLAAVGLALGIWILAGTVGPRTVEGQAEPKAVAETRRRLNAEIDLDFEKTSLDNVLKYINEAQQGLNIVIDPDIAAGGVDLSTRVVDLKVKRISVQGVLDTILEFR